MSNSKKLIHPTFNSCMRTMSLVDYGSQSFVTVPLSKLVYERKETDPYDIYKRNMYHYKLKSFISVDINNNSSLFGFY